MNITQNAAAKINLYLHVTGKRGDGYHLLDSLVVFAGADETSDRLDLAPARGYSLSITGPEAGALNQEDPEKNLITKALRILGGIVGRAAHASLVLHKNLPVASGIGGGSADAAAALRGMAKLWDIRLDDPRLLQAARETGADVPACLYNRPCYFGGIGDAITPVQNLPRFYLLLVNPHIPLPTMNVFKARMGEFHPAQRFEAMPKTADELAAALALRHNDLQEAACGLVEAVRDVLEVIAAQPGCLLSRMSGSGATCFGMFAEETSARQAAQRIKEQMRGCWAAVSLVT